MSPIFPRYAAQNLREALEDFPATLIQGPRQCGKTTLALHVGKARGYSYLSFDDKVVRFGSLINTLSRRNLFRNCAVQP